MFCEGISKNGFFKFLKFLFIAELWALRGQKGSFFTFCMLYCKNYLWDFHQTKFFSLLKGISSDSVYQIFDLAFHLCPAYVGGAGVCHFYKDFEKSRERTQVIHTVNMVNSHSLALVYSLEAAFIKLL